MGWEIWLFVVRKASLVSHPWVASQADSSSLYFHKAVHYVWTNLGFIHTSVRAWLFANQTEASDLHKKEKSSVNVTWSLLTVVSTLDRPKNNKRWTYKIKSFILLLALHYRLASELGSVSPQVLLLQPTTHVARTHQCLVDCSTKLNWLDKLSWREFPTSQLRNTLIVPWSRLNVVCTFRVTAFHCFVNHVNGFNGLCLLCFSFCALCWNGFEPGSTSRTLHFHSARCTIWNYTRGSCKTANTTEEKPCPHPKYSTLRKTKLLAVTTLFWLVGSGSSVLISFQVVSGLFAWISLELHDEFTMWRLRKQVHGHSFGQFESHSLDSARFWTRQTENTRHVVETGRVRHQEVEGRRVVCLRRPLYFMPRVLLRLFIRWTITSTERELTRVCSEKRQLVCRRHTQHVRWNDFVSTHEQQLGLKKCRTVEFQSECVSTKSNRV